MTSHRVGRARQPFQVPRDRLALGAHRQGKVRIVRLARAATRPFVHHEVAAMGLDGRLEPIHGLDYIEQLLRALRSREANPECREAISQLS
jgi:hypothetical protein